MSNDTKKTTIDEAVVPETIEGLIKSRKAWDSGTRKASLDERNKLLGSCLDLYKEISSSTKLQRALNSYLDNRQIIYNSGTSLSLKLLRVVFMEAADTKEPPQRLYEYRRVLEKAKEAGITGADLPTYIEQNGGTDGLRRQSKNGQSPTEAKKDLIDKAERAFEARPTEKMIATGIEPISSIDLADGSPFCVGVLRREKNGSVSIVLTSSNRSDLNNILARAGKELNDEDLEQAKRKIETQQSQTKENESEALTKTMGSIATAA